LIGSAAQADEKAGCIKDVRQQGLQMKNSILPVIGFLVFFCCSEGIEGPEPRPPTISESYLALAIHYNSRSISGIRAFYSPIFLHDGLSTNDLDSLWNFRIGDGATTITDVGVAVHDADSLADCSVDVYFRRGAREDTLYIAPGGEFDDVCYWKKEGDYWKLYGNQSGRVKQRGIRGGSEHAGKDCSRN
jgi:hypothetical protein